LSADWGFWYTATNNLKKIKRFISEVDKLGVEAEIDPKNLEKEDKEEIVHKIDALLEKIDKEPKSLGWKMRSKAGTMKRWYNPVERPETVGGFQIWETLFEKE